MFTQWTADKQHRHIVKNATHCDYVPVSAVKGFMGTVDQNMVPTWHQVLWLGRGVEAIVGLGTKLDMDTMSNPEEPGVVPTCEFHPVFLSRSSPHIAHLPVGEGHVVFWQGPYQLEVRKTKPTDVNAPIRFALGGVVPPARSATAWQLINVVPAWSPPKQAKSGLWSITCPCDVQVSFCVAHVVEAHTFHAILAQILHQFRTKCLRRRSSTRITCTTIFAIILHKFCTNFT